VLEVASRIATKEVQGKGKKKATTIVQDLGSDSKDETKVTTMGIKGKYFCCKFSSHTSSSKDNVIPDGRKIK
jgi:hypothetical protein